MQETHCIGWVRWVAIVDWVVTIWSWVWHMRWRKIPCGNPHWIVIAIKFMLTSIFTCLMFTHLCGSLLENSVYLPQRHCGPLCVLVELVGQSVGHILGKIQGYCGDRLKKRGVVSLIVCVLMEKKGTKVAHTDCCCSSFNVTVTCSQIYYWALSI